jgi:hypothetical protein
VCCEKSLIEAVDLPGEIFITYLKKTESLICKIPIKSKTLEYRNPLPSYHHHCTTVRVNSAKLITEALICLHLSES